MNLSPEDRAVGQDNFHEAVGTSLSRRGFLKASVTAAVTPPVATQVEIVIIVKIPLPPLCKGGGRGISFTVVAKPRDCW